MLMLYLVSNSVCDINNTFALNSRTPYVTFKSNEVCKLYFFLLAISPFQLIRAINNKKQT